MKKPINTQNTADTGVPKSRAMRNLSEQEKQALELKEQAEHETTSERTRLQEAAKRKMK